MTVLPLAPPKGGAFGLYCYSKGKPSLQWAKEFAMRWYTVEVYIVGVDGSQELLLLTRVMGWNRFSAVTAVEENCNCDSWFKLAKDEYSPRLLIVVTE